MTFDYDDDTYVVNIVYTETFIIPPQTMFVGGYTVFTLSVRPFVRNVLFP